MDNLSQTMLNALANASAAGKKVNLDEVLKEALREEIERGVNEIIGHELTAFLGYERGTQGASKELGNSRNGYYERMLNTSYGVIKVEVPRDRKSEFETCLFERGRRSTKNIGQTILKLYSAGMTDSQIQEIVESLYDHRYSSSTISAITDAVKEDVERFASRPTKERYFALFADAIYIPLRRDTVEKEAVCIGHNQFVDIGRSNL